MSSQNVRTAVKVSWTSLIAILIYVGLASPVSASVLDRLANYEIPTISLPALNIVPSQSYPTRLATFDREPQADLDGYEVRFYGPSIPPTVSEFLLDVCQERGYGQECAQTLLGMIWKESRFKADAIGDHGLAHGYFQIHYRLHGISLACAQDLGCSANWTISYMESNGYPNAQMWAIQCHNGCGVRNGYAAAVQYHGRRLWPKAEISRNVALK